MSRRRYGDQFSAHEELLDYTQTTKAAELRCLLFSTHKGQKCSKIKTAVRMARAEQYL